MKPAPTEPGGEAYTLRVLARVREVPREAWDALLGQESSPFVEHTWLDLLEETGCVGAETGWTPAHLSLWRGGRLAALAPAYLKGHSEGEYVFDWSWAEASHRMGVPYYPKLVVGVPFAPATGDRVLVSSDAREDREHVTRALAAAARHWCERAGASGVHVLFPGEDEARAWEAAGYLRRDGVQYHWRREGARSFEDYLARFSSKQRNQMKRELRAVRDRGIVVRALEAAEHTREAARAMHRFYVSTAERHGPWGRVYMNERFFEALTERFRHRLAWVLARDERSGAPIAGAFNVAGGRRMYGRHWGAAADVPHLHFVVCYYEGIRACIERGIDVFEGGSGRDEHKRTRGFAPALTRSVHWVADGRLRSALAPWLAHERARVAAFLTEP